MRTHNEKPDRLAQITALIKECRNGKLDHALLESIKQDAGYAELGQEIEQLFYQGQEEKRTFNSMEQRLINNLETLFEFANQNFDKKAYISEEGNMFDALSGAINMLGKEIQNRTISRDYFNNILQSLQDMIFVVNTDGVIESINNATYRSLGYEKHDLPGKKLSEILQNHPQSFFREASSCAPAFFKHQSGRQIPVLLSWSDFQKFDNIKSGKVCIAKDISDIKAKEELIRQQNEELKKKNSFLDTFVFTAAHDLRAPISNLQSLLELYQDEKDVFLRDQLFDGLIKSVHKLTLTVNGLVRLLDLQQNSEVGTSILFFKKVYENVIQGFQSQIASSKAQITIDFRSQPRICYNESFLQSIIYNVVSNAIKFRKEGKPLKIQLKTYREKDFIILKVQDNGMGIDLKTSRHLLFKPFKKLTSHASGTGIGLSVLQSIVEKNGGKVEVSSTVDKGSTFWIYLKSYTIQKKFFKSV
jgi:PAS domain S-box-containing protein